MTQNKTSPTKVSSGTKTITATSTACSGLLLALSTVFSNETQKIIMACTPFVSTLISWIGLILYCKFVEPPAFAAYRAGLKRDLKILRKILKDKYASEKSKKDAQKNYDETSLLLANLHKNNSSIDICSKALPNSNE